MRDFSVSFFCKDSRICTQLMARRWDGSVACPLVGCLSRAKAGLQARVSDVQPGVMCNILDKGSDLG